MAVDENATEAALITPEAEQAAPAGNFVTAEAFTAAQAANTAALQRMAETMEALAARGIASHQPAPATPAIEDASDEEIDAALAEGKGAKTFRKMMSAATKRLEQQFDARTNELESTGLGSLATLAGEVAKPGLTYYTRFKKEIDNYVAQMPAAARANPMSFKMAHDIVVGQNIAAITKEERESATRTAANPSPAPGAANGRAAANATAEPTFDSVFGNEAKAQLAEVGRDPESFARKLGYKDAAEYAKLAADQEKELYANVR